MVKTSKSTGKSASGNGKTRRVRSPEEIDEARGQFGAWMLETRTGKGQTQGDASRAIGVHSITISLWETGAQKPTIESIRALSDWSGADAMDIWDLISGDIG